MFLSAASVMKNDYRFCKLLQLQTRSILFMPLCLRGQEDSLSNYDVNSITINGHTFLAFPDYYSGRKHNIDPFIYKWHGSKFVLFQSVATRGAKSSHPFVISCQTDLRLANYHDDIQKQHGLLYSRSLERGLWRLIPTYRRNGMTSFETKVILS